MVASLQSGARAAASTSLIFDKVEDPLIKHVCGVHPHITTGFLPIGCARSKIIAFDQLSCNMVRNMDYRMYEFRCGHWVCCDAAVLDDALVTVSSFRKDQLDWFTIERVAESCEKRTQGRENYSLVVLNANAKYDYYSSVRQGSSLKPQPRSR